MKNLDCNEIKNLEIIGEEDKNKKNMYKFFFLNLTKFLQFSGEREREREREREFSIVRKLDF